MKKMYQNYLEKDHSFDKKTLISILCLLIVITGIYGFLYEYIFYYFNGGMKYFYWRGGHFLPWINIYAYGSLGIYFTTYKKRKNPWKVFLISMLLCGALEFITGFVMDIVRSGDRCWDYNQEIWNFGNIGGFICLRSVLFFGISGLILIYGLVPICFYLAKKVNKKVFFFVTITLCSIFFFDEIYNCFIARIFHLPRAYDIYSKLGVHYMKFK